METIPLSWRAPREGKLETLLSESAAHVDAPFSDARIASLQAFSKVLLADQALRAWPPAITLAYWLRKGNLQALRERFLARHGNEAVWAPTGLVFHLVPGNVDTLFIYSWALAYLCGNVSLVRLSRNESSLVERLLEHLNTCMVEDQALRAANAFVRYGHDDALTETISRACNLRIIWGGDATVETIRRIPLNPHASELAFPDKTSYALFDARAWLALDEVKAAEVAEAFYVGLFPFDQMACSSPQFLFWVGEPQEVEVASLRFDDALETVVRRREPETDASAALRRRNAVMSLMAREGVQADVKRYGFIALQEQRLERVRALALGGRVLTHVPLAKACELADFAKRCDQTVAIFGVQGETLRELAALLGRRGVARCVPVGQALAFSEIWDGHDLPRHMVRAVEVSA